MQNEAEQVFCSKQCIPEQAEILNCKVCNFYVKGSSILCSLCNTWIDQQCAKLTDNELNDLSSDDIDDWICFPCKKSIFPL